MARKQNQVQVKHTERMELAEKKHAAGLLSERFPNVSGISIRLTHYRNKEGAVLLVRTVNVFPDSDAYFHMNCMTRECTNGGFDLTNRVVELIRNKKNFGKGEMTCSGGGQVSLDHSHISYEISVRYHKCSE